MNNVVGGLIGCVCVLSLAGNALLYQRYSTARTLFKVNDQVIRRKDLDDRLDYLYSSGVLRDMIEQDVIVEAATKAKVMPTQADVDQQYNQLERAAPQIIEQAKAHDPSLQLFRESLKTRIALRNLQIQGITASDDEVAAYYARHKQEFRLPPQVKSVVALARDSISAQAAAQLFEQGDSPQVVSEQPGVRVLGLNGGQPPSLPPQVEQAMYGMKANTAKTFPIGSQTCLVAYVKSVTPAQIPPLSAIESQVAIAARLAKAPTQQQEMAKLMAAAHVEAETTRYADAVPNYSSSAASGQQ